MDAAGFPDNGDSAQDVQSPAASAAVADGLSHPIDPRWVAYERKVGWVTSLGFAAVLAAAVAGAVLAGELPLTPLAAGAIVVAIIRAAVRQWRPAVAYRYMSYRLSARALEIRRGILWRQVIDVPRSRIQHSDVSQGPFERMHGLGTLSVFTAGTRYSVVRLHGLAHERALAIREYLMQADEHDVV